MTPIFASLLETFLGSSCYLSWGFEAKPDTFVVAGELFFSLLATISDQNTLLVLEDGGLFLISPLGLWDNKEKQIKSWNMETTLTRFLAWLAGQRIIKLLPLVDTCDHP